jgi:hypothetical protein
MGLETGTHLDDLIATNPTGGDDRSTADDHIRLIKAVLLATFPNLTGAMTANQSELNILDGALLTTAELNILAGLLATQSELNALNSLTNNRALTSNNSGLIKTSVTTATELEYLSGVTGPIQDQIDALAPGGRGVLISKSSSQSINNDTYTTISYDTAIYDTDSAYSGGAPTRITIPTGVSKAQFTAAATINALFTTGDFGLQIKKNGSSFAGNGGQMLTLGSSSSNYPNLNISSAWVAVTPGDYFEVNAYQKTGSAFNILQSSGAGVGVDTFFCGNFI